jgi:hypothetical protein
VLVLQPTVPYVRAELLYCRTYTTVLFVPAPRRKAGSKSFALLTHISKKAEHEQQLIVDIDISLKTTTFSSIQSTMSPNVEIGRTAKITQLREDAVMYLEDLLADKLGEVAMLQKQLAVLSKHHVRDSDMVDPYGDSGKYTGHVHNEKAHGKGTMLYDDGRVYAGTLT